MSDAVLINPPANIRMGQCMEHLGLGYMASMLRKNGFSVEIINAPTEELDFDGLKTELSHRSFDLLGVSILFQTNLSPVLKWLDSLRKGGLQAHIAIGGHPATFTYREILTEYDGVDSVVRGEGETTLVELLRRIKEGVDWRSVDGIAWLQGDQVVVNPGRPLADDLDSLPWPARDVFEARPEAFEHLAVSGSRGCYRACSFCSIATFYRSFKGRAWRGRDPEDVLDEIDAVRKINPHEYVLLVDDTFIGPGEIGRQRAFEFVEALGRRGTDYLLSTSCRADQVEEELFRELKKVGLGLVFLGIESGNEETLRLFDKHSRVEDNRKALEILKKLGIWAEVGFIMFNPYTTFPQIRQDLDFLLETGSGPDIRNLSELGLFPGEPLIAKLEDDGLLHGSPFDYSVSYVDDRIESFLGSIRNCLFKPEAFSTLRIAERMVQAARIGMIPLPKPKLAEIEAVVKEFYIAARDALNKNADIFEKRQNTSEHVLAVRREYERRSRALSEKAKKLVGKGIPVATGA